MKASLDAVRNAAVVAVITLALLAAIEVGLRIVLPTKDKPNEYMFHPDYLFALRPDRSHVFRRSAENGGESITVRVNSHGFRGADASSTSDGIRVMVYGDSNIQASFSEREATFPARLQIELQRALEEKVEVLNMGVAGYSPAQYVLQVRDQFEVWCPDAIVIHIFAANDYGDLIRNKLFRVGKDGRLVHNTQAAILRRHALEEKSTSLLGLAKESQTLRFLRRVLARVNAPLAPSKVGRSSNPMSIEEEIAKHFSLLDRQFVSYMERDNPEHLTPVQYDYDLALEPGRKSSRVKRQLMRKVLERLAEYSTQFSVPFIFLIQPSVRDISTNLSPNYTHFLTYSETYRRSYLADLLEEMLREITLNGHQDISAVNLFNHFRADGESSYFFKGRDNHWNDAGQRLAANITARHMMEIRSHWTEHNRSECRRDQ